ncbi:MAG: squalene synthase HpnC [Ignavibacteriae bacterium]|nr:squalene synthase HpnC [Ignavibacteriota bacterium]
MNLDKAYMHCRKIALGHYENFPVGSLLFPAKYRKYIYAIYAFARTADDIADSDELSSEEKLKLLNEMDLKLDRISENNTLDDEIFFALSDTVRTVGIPVQEFKNLLIAFRQDSHRQKYEEFDELIEYSRYSANPIGHLVLYVSGLKDEKLFRLSDYVCTALQLANFWQDVSVDLKMGRIYIPQSEMKKFNYCYELLNVRNENSDFIALIKYLVDRTRSIFSQGKELENFLKGRMKYEFRTMYRGGMIILDKIEKIEYRVISQRVNIGKAGKLNLLLKIFAKL